MYISAQVTGTLREWYYDVGAVVEAADKAGLARKVARLEPMICVKG